MNTRIRSLLMLGIAATLVSACTVAPEVREQREAIQADIAEILSLSRNIEELGEPATCLAEFQIRGFRPLGESHLLFEGTGDKLWVNTLGSRCVDLRYGDVLVTRQFTSTRLCRNDRFEVTDWFAWPMYRRWPWAWGSWGSGEICRLGEFHPVTQTQVDEIQALLDSAD